MLQVGEISRKLGLNPQTLYFYERIGLIPSPKRSQAGYRLYDEKDLERLTFITRTKALGLSLEEIKELLNLQNKGDLSCQQVHEILLNKVRYIEQQIAQLQVLKSELLPLLKQCQIEIESQERNSQCIVLSERKRKKSQGSCC